MHHRALVFTLCSLYHFCIFAHSPETDNRSWYDAKKSFYESKDFGRNGQRDGKRLLKLNHEKAMNIIFNLFHNPTSFHQKAASIHCIGWNKIKRGIPYLIDIISDKKSALRIKQLSLNPGLRYMNSKVAIEAAINVLNSNQVDLHSSAIWVLSEHGTEKCVSKLNHCLINNDNVPIKKKIYALMYSNMPDAYKHINDFIQLKDYSIDSDIMQAYAVSMSKFYIKGAYEKMKKLLDSKNRLTRYYAIKYFGNNPCQEAANSLISLYTNNNKYIKLNRDIFSKYMNSRDIKKDTKTKLGKMSDIITTKIRHNKRNVADRE